MQSNGEMQRLLQERLVEQVHELDDVISNNKSQLLNEIQVQMILGDSICDISRIKIGDKGVKGKGILF